MAGWKRTRILSSSHVFWKYLLTSASWNKKSAGKWKFKFCVCVCVKSRRPLLPTLTSRPLGEGYWRHQTGPIDSVSLPPAAASLFPILYTPFSVDEGPRDLMTNSGASAIKPKNWDGATKSREKEKRDLYGSARVPHVSQMTPTNPSVSFSNVCAAPKH